jgi:hypothetical protein
MEISVNNNRLIDNQFAEIITPQAPPDHTVLIIALACLVALIVSVMLYLFVNRNSKIKAARKLKTLKKQNVLVADNHRQFALEVAASLRMAFDVRNLDCLLPQSDSEGEWQRFRSRLSESCFGVAPPSADEVDYLVCKAQNWLHALSVSKVRVD